MKFFQNTKLLYVLSGILLGIGFLYSSVWFLGLLGAALYLKILSSDSTSQVWGSYVTWTTKFLFVLGFYWTIYPIKWLPFDFGNGELWLVGLYWLTVSMFVGLGGVVFGFAYKKLAGIYRHTDWSGYIILPVVWAAAEVAGSFLLSVFTYGPGGLINGYFSLGYLGLLLAEQQWLLPLASLGGVYGLSIIAAAFAYWLSHYGTSQIRLRQLWLPITVMVVLIGSNLLPPTAATAPRDTVAVAVISTSYPVAELFNREAVADWSQEQAAALDVAMSTEAAYLITPEDSRFFNQTDGGEQAKDFFNFKYPDANTVIIDSSRVQLEDQSVLQGFVFDAGTNDHTAIHKKYLVPQGEFVPYLYNWLFRVLGQGFIIDELESALSYRIGPNVSQANLPEHYPGVLFCFESSSGSGVRSLVQQRPNLPFVAHPVSHVWFNQPESLWSQLETSLQVQAVWNDISIVSANNHGPSQLFSPDGSITSPRTIGSGEHWEVGLFSVPVR